MYICETIPLNANFKYKVKIMKTFAKNFGFANLFFLQLLDDYRHNLYICLWLLQGSEDKEVEYGGWTPVDGLKLWQVNSAKEARKKEATDEVGGRRSDEADSTVKTVKYLCKSFSQTSKICKIYIENQIILQLRAQYADKA